MDSALHNGVISLEEDLENENLGACISCRRFTENRCDRCRDHYCSQQCQHNDWPNHRYICFPMPSLVNNSQPLTEDDIFPEHPPEYTVNSSTMLKEIHNLMRILGDKVQKIEEKVTAIKNMKTTTNDRSDLESISEVPQTDNKTNYSSDSERFISESVAYKNAINTSNNQRDPVTVRENDSTSTETNDSAVDRVVLSAFRSTNRCAIRSKDAKTESAFRAVTEKIDRYGRDAPPMETLPKVGSHAIILSTNKQYRRVKIQKIGKGDKIFVLFCDYGSTLIRKLADLRVISDEIANLPEYVSIVQLHGVNMLQASDKITNFLKSFEWKEFRIKYINEKEMPHVELYDTENNQLLNEVIAKFYSENDNTDKATPSRQLPNSTANKGDPDSSKSTAATAIASGSSSKSPTVSSDVSSITSTAESEEATKPTSTAESEEATKPTATAEAEESTKPTATAEADEATKTTSTAESEEATKPTATAEAEEATKTTATVESEDENVLVPDSIPLIQKHIFTANLVNTEVIVVDNTLVEYGYLACILKKDMKYLSQIQNSLNKIEFDSMEAYKPKVDEYCIAQYENDWYRGQVIDICDGGAKFDISYIDFLNGATLTSDRIRRYPKDFKVDCYTTLCKIDNLPKKLTDKHQEFLRSTININDSICIDRVVQVSENVALIEFSQIISDMHSKNLI